MSLHAGRPTVAAGLVMHDVIESTATAISALGVCPVHHHLRLRVSACTYASVCFLPHCIISAAQVRQCGCHKPPYRYLSLSLHSAHLTDDMTGLWKVGIFSTLDWTMANQQILHCSRRLSKKSLFGATLLESTHDAAPWLDNV